MGKILAISSVLMLVVAYCTFKLAALMDYLDGPSVIDSNDKCKILNLPLELEDMAVYNEIVIGGMNDMVNSMLKANSVDKSEQGGLIAIDPVTQSTYTIQMTFPQGVSFHPHGIHVFENSLFVVNHAYGVFGQRVEIFNLSTDLNGKIKATHKQSVQFGLEYTGIFNDILAVSDSQFYISIWKPHIDTPNGKEVNFSLLNSLIDYQIIKKTKVLFCSVSEGKFDCKEQGKGFMMNGITRRHNQLFVGDSMDKSIHVFDIQQDFSLQKVKTIQTDFPTDNLEYSSETDMLYLGHFMKVHEGLKFFKDLTVGNPLDNIAVGISRVEFKDDQHLVRRLGVIDHVNMLSGALRFKGKILAAAPDTRGVVICTGLEATDNQFQKFTQV